MLRRVIPVVLWLSGCTEETPLTAAPTDTGTYVVTDVTIDTSVPFDTDGVDASSDSGDAPGDAGDVASDGYSSCCPISESPMCCMMFGGSRDGGICGLICDSIPTMLSRRIDDAGCPYWYSPAGSPTTCNPFLKDSGAVVDSAATD